MKGAVVLIAGLALCSIAPASAQKKPNLDGERVLADFARCAVRAAPRETHALIDSPPGSADEQAHLESLLQNHWSCLHLGPSIQSQQLAASVSLGQTSLTSALSQLANQQQHMTFSRSAFRGAIAERLYLGSGETAPASRGGIASHADSGVPPAGYVIVRCAAERDPVSADRLVRSKRLSSAEGDAARALAPALNACARGKAHVDISGTAIHGWAAEALYRQRYPVAMQEAAK